MRYVLWAGKAGLCLFWLGALMVLSSPLAKPFGLLLGCLLALMVCIHCITLALYYARLNVSVLRWQDRLQLLLFGAFHLQELNLAPASPNPDASEGGTDGGQTDQR